MAHRTAKQRRADNTRQAKLAQLAAAERRRRARLTGSLGAVGVIIVIVAVMVGIKLAGGPNNSKDVSGTASDKVVSTVTSVPAGTFAQVGAGTVANPPKAISGSAVTADGKPKVLYVGAEYCPYCAAERWSMVAALSRFGTWSGLGETTSTSQDVYPNTPTLSFHGASYTSSYLSFAGYETADRNGQPLDTMSGSDQKLFNKYDAPPYVSADAAKKIPFVLFGGKYIVNGASYDPGVLKGLSHKQVARAMHDPGSAVAKAVDGTANAITAAVCKVTGDKPANVCSSPGVKAGAAKLQSAS